MSLLSRGPSARVFRRTTRWGLICSATSQWTLGKNANRSGPLGPLVPADAVGDLRTGLRRG